jgi:predicted transcriptional regulator
LGKKGRLARSPPRSYFSSMSVKESVLQAISRLPDDAGYKDIADEIAFLAALEQAEDDIEAGRFVSNEEARKKLDWWTAS